jgi:peptidoglycan/LPS O-acetylase OafA/YrhL
MLGDWSFALYCLHTPVFAYYGWARFGAAWFDAMQQTLGAHSLASWEIVPCFAALLALSCAMHHAVEKPLRARLVGELDKLAPACGPCGKDRAAAAGAPVAADASIAVAPARQPQQIV